MPFSVYHLHRAHRVRLHIHCPFTSLRTNCEGVLYESYMSRHIKTMGYICIV